MRRFSAVESVAFAFFYPGVSRGTLEMLANAEPHVASGMPAIVESHVASGVLANLEPPVGVRVRQLTRDGRSLCGVIGDLGRSLRAPGRRKSQCYTDARFF